MEADNKSSAVKKSLIERVDNTLLEFNKKLAIKWMKRTGKSKSDLEKELYYGSGMLIGTCAITGGNYLLMLPAGFGLMAGNNESLRPRSKDYATKPGEESRPRFYGDVILYGLGVTQTLIGAGSLVASLVTNDKEMCHTSLRMMSLGVGVIGWMSANYVSKADIVDPLAKKETAESKLDENMFRYK